MNSFPFVGGVLHADAVPLPELAERFGTPLYVYSASGVRRRFQKLRGALEGVVERVDYSVKACSNLAILELLSGLGAGFDVVSGGEIDRCLRAGVPGNSIAFAGVGKTVEELQFALRVGVGQFHVESREEFETLAEEAGILGVRARVAVRLNPGVAVPTHSYLSTAREGDKFGVTEDVARQLLIRGTELPSIQADGIHVHLGSQIKEVEPFEEAAVRVLELVDWAAARGIHIGFANLGGGFGISSNEAGLDVVALARAWRRVLSGRSLSLVVEPGRYLIGPEGVLLARVIRVKQAADRVVVVTDAAMNDFLRPALYQAEHPVLVVTSSSRSPEDLVDFAGPVCETADFLARDRRSVVPEPGELIAVGDAGAYGFSMASNYNSRPRPAEVLVDGEVVRCIRRRETMDDLLAAEIGLPDPH